MLRRGPWPAPDTSTLLAARAREKDRRALGGEMIPEIRSHEVVKCYPAVSCVLPAAEPNTDTDPTPKDQMIRFSGAVLGGWTRERKVRNFGRVA